MLAGLSAVAGTGMVGGALPLAAQDKPVVGLRYQNFKRARSTASIRPRAGWSSCGRISAA